MSDSKARQNQQIAELKRQLADSESLAIHLMQVIIDYCQEHENDGIALPRIDIPIPETYWRAVTV